jgi:hypothetical protein
MKISLEKSQSQPRKNSETFNFLNAEVLPLNEMLHAEIDMNFLWYIFTKVKQKIFFEL